MCWEMHEKPIDQKPRQNNRNRGYQVSIDHQTDKFQEKKSIFNETLNSKTNGTTL